MTRQWIDLARRIADDALGQAGLSPEQLALATQRVSDVVEQSRWIRGHVVDIRTTADDITVTLNNEWDNSGNWIQFLVSDASFRRHNTHNHRYLPELLRAQSHHLVVVVNYAEDPHRHIKSLAVTTP